MKTDFRFPLSAMFRWVLLASCVVAAACTWWQPGIANATVHYVSLGVLLFYALRPFIRWPRVVPVAVVGVLFLYLLFCDKYYDGYRTPPGGFVREAFARWSDKPYWRYQSLDIDGRWITLEGYVTRSDEWHGPVRIRDSRLPFAEQVSKRYFWYGEEVSEGEWHLRRK